MSTNSTATRRRRKCSGRPPKPYSEFPLSAHASGHWAKRIRGHLYYFGRWSERVNDLHICLPDGGNWQAALNKYRDEIDDIQAGRKRRGGRALDSGGIRLHGLCNRFLLAKYNKLQRGAMRPDSFKEFNQAVDLLITVFGRERLAADFQPDDFEELMRAFPVTWGPSRRDKIIGNVRSVFIYGNKNRHIKPPVEFGSEFRRSDKKERRKHRASLGKGRLRLRKFA